MREALGSAEPRDLVEKGGKQVKPDEANVHARPASSRVVRHDQNGEASLGNDYVAQRMAMASLSIIGAVMVFFVHRTTPTAATLMVAAVALLAVLSDIDIRTHRLPNNIVGPFAVATTVVVAVAGVVQSDTGRAVAAIGTGVAVAVGALVLNLIGGMGMGDVKLCYPVFVIAGWLGSSAVTTTLVVTAFGGLVAAVVVMISSGRGKFSYGPFLALGSVAGMIMGVSP